MDRHNDNEMWDWQEGEYCLQKDTNLGISQSLWDGVSRNDEDASYMFDETTPVKACGDMAYHIADNVNTNKELEHCREMSSQLKRRRMLQFDNKILDTPLCNEGISTLFLKSKEREDSLESASSDMSQWVSVFSEDTSALGYEGLDQSSEGWLADCFTDAELHCMMISMNLSGAFDVYIDISEFCNAPPECKATVAQKHPTRTRRNVVIRGKKPSMQTPTKLVSSVAYPFDFIKPCGAHGDVTLKDINQRIRTPRPSKSKQSK